MLPCACVPGASLTCPRCAYVPPMAYPQNDQFMQDGAPVQLRAGCIHYSRVPLEYWEDRLLRLRAMGLNSVQTYVPWNWHQPSQNGPVDFTGYACACVCAPACMSVCVCVDGSRVTNTSCAHRCAWGSDACTCLQNVVCVLVLLYPLALQQNREASVASPAGIVRLFPFCLRPPALASPAAARPPPPSALMAHMCSDRNLTAFLAIAQRLNMLVVLRAGPYMCGEWEFGGLPAWLFANGSITLRTMAQPYWAHVEAWWGQHLLPAVRPMLYTNGGPVVMVQVENEYGSYGG